MQKTSLSAGDIIGKMLSEDPEVLGRANRLWPVVADEEAIKPYIIYRRSSMEMQPQKNVMGAETVNVEVQCYADTYEDSVELAEAVKRCLDHQQCTIEYKDGEESKTLTMRSCTLVNSSETWEHDAYAQGLLFNIKI